MSKWTPPLPPVDALLVAASVALLEPPPCPLPLVDESGWGVPAHPMARESVRGAVAKARMHAGNPSEEKETPLKTRTVGELVFITVSRGDMPVLLAPRRRFPS